MSKIKFMKRKVSDEGMVREARRRIQRALLSIDCSVDVNPNSLDGRKVSDTVIPVVEIKVSDGVNLSEINSAVFGVVGEFDMCGVVSRNSKGNGFSASVYKRKSSDVNAPAITFRDVVEDIRASFKKG